MKAVILAAGKGTRMLPLSENIPKPLLPVVGKPFLHFLIEEIKKAGITDIGVVVNYFADKIKEKFPDLSYIKQETPKGTADAILSAQDFVGKDDFIVLMADDFYSAEDIKNIASINGNAIGYTTVDDPSNYGVIQEKDGFLENIIEKPQQFISNKINTALYKFDSSVFDACKKVRPSSREEYEITDALLILSKQNKVQTIKINLWRDFSYLWDILTMNAYFLDKIQSKIDGEVSKQAHIEGNIIVGKGTKILAGTYIEGPVYIGENCRIGPNAYIRPGSTIGNKCKVGASCEIKNSIIMDNSCVPHLSYIGDSIIGMNSNIGAGTILSNVRFDNEIIHLRIAGKRIMHTGKRKFGAVVGHNVQTGANATIMPGRIIWNNRLIMPGEVVYEDVL